MILQPRFPILNPSERVRVCQLTCLAHQGAKALWKGNPLLAGACVNSALALYLALLEEFDSGRLSIPPRFVIGTFLAPTTRNQLAKKNKILKDMNFNHAWTMVGAEVYDPTMLQFTKEYPFYAGPSNLGIYVPRVFNMRAVQKAFMFPETQLPQNLAAQIKDYIDLNKYSIPESCVKVCKKGWTAQ